jgi:hypothetical protein
MFSIDVSADLGKHGPIRTEHRADQPGDEVRALLQQLVAGQERQNRLLEELIQQTSSVQKQRASELGQWRKSNPELAQGCRSAAETLSRVQTEFLQHLTNEINDNADVWVDSDFLMNEFVDRYGPRLAHLNGVLQVLSQLSSNANTANSAQ